MTTLGLNCTMPHQLVVIADLREGRRLKKKIVINNIRVRLISVKV